MNTKLLILISFFAAILGHLFIFNFVTFVFPVTPVAFKPKFFFLGPILQQDDVYQESRNDLLNKSEPASSNYFSQDKTDLKNIRYETPLTQQEPFAIETIRKPLIAQTTKKQGKVLIKSTFELTPEKTIESEPQPQASEDKLNIQPYRPLRSRAFKNPYAQN